MYFFGLSKEEVLSQKHVVSYKETCKQQNPIKMVTLFGRQVYPVKTETSKPDDNRYKGINSSELIRNDIDLRLPADHYAYNNWNGIEGSVELAYEANKAKEASAKNWSGKRNPRIVIDLEEPPPNPDTEPNDRIISNILKAVDQSLLEDDDNKESGLLDLNTTPADEIVSEPHYSFLQDLNCPYIEETESSCEKSGVDDDPTPLSSPKRHEKDGTASPASYTSCCTTDNNSRRSSSPQALVPSCRTRLEFPATDCNEDEESFSEMIQMAAKSLVHISVISYQNQEDQDFLDKPVEPGCSCDSYELHTLGINETNTEEEDCCVSSMAVDELNNVINSKEIGLKLRRGRRMKNFQKEILPSLTSLTRHEIREDINILEAVLRSREYKKMQGKTKDVKFGANPRNKRSSTQRYVGKRRRKND